MNKAELQTTKTNVSNEEMAYTHRELKDMIVELIDSHLDALNKIQTTEGKLVAKYRDILGFGTDPMIHDL